MIKVLLLPDRRLDVRPDDVPRRVVPGGGLHGHLRRGVQVHHGQLHAQRQRHGARRQRVPGARPADQH